MKTTPIKNQGRRIEIKTIAPNIMEEVPTSIRMESEH
jgi:hypothetical protein